MGLQGVQMDYVHPSTTSHIPAKYRTVAQYLQQAGYRTELYGKWHAGYAKRSYTPTQRGFDGHVGQYQYAINPFNKHNLDAWATAKDWFKDGHFDDDGQARYASDILLGMSLVSTYLLKKNSLQTPFWRISRRTAQRTSRCFCTSPSRTRTFR